MCITVAEEKLSDKILKKQVDERIKEIDTPCCEEDILNTVCREINRSIEELLSNCTGDLTYFKKIITQMYLCRVRGVYGVYGELVEFAYENISSKCLEEYIEDIRSSRDDMTADWVVTSHRIVAKSIRKAAESIDRIEYGKTPSFVKNKIKRMVDSL